MAPEDSAGSEALLQTFESRFLAARALPSFPWQSLEEKLRESSDSELLLDILQKTVKHPVCEKHPPSVKYSRRFLSELIKKSCRADFLRGCWMPSADESKPLSTTQDGHPGYFSQHEAAHTEPLDALYEALAEVLMAKESARCHRSYLLPSGASVTLSESTAIVSYGTTGLVTWDAALYLAEWAIKNPTAFTNRTVLELGSGAGLTGLAICKTCRPRAYVFSDCHSRVLEQLRSNVLLNGLSSQPDAATEPGCTQVSVVELDWETVTASQLSALQPDIVIAADVLYCPEVTLSLVRVLKRLAACQRKCAPDVCIAYTLRNPEMCQLFTTELDQAGIYWEEVPPLTRKVFPYEEGSAVEMLKLQLQVTVAPEGYDEMKSSPGTSSSWEVDV